MKEMYYSEVLDKYFDSRMDCKRAELKYQIEKQEQEKLKKQEEEKKNAEVTELSNKKKVMADAISAADKKLTDAQNDYKIAYDAYKEKLVEARKAYNKSLEDIKNAYNKAVEDAANELTPSSTLVKDAQKEKYEAIRTFNQKFGPYTVKLTGDEAYKEMVKAMDNMNSVFTNAFRDFWF